MELDCYENNLADENQQERQGNKQNIPGPALHIVIVVMYENKQQQKRSRYVEDVEQEVAEQRSDKSKIDQEESIVLIILPLKNKENTDHTQHEKQPRDKKPNSIENIQLLKSMCNNSEKTYLDNLGSGIINADIHQYLDYIRKRDHEKGIAEILVDALLTELVNLPAVDCYEKSNDDSD
jgi:hypothetical protein